MCNAGQWYLLQEEGQPQEAVLRLGQHVGQPGGEFELRRRWQSRSCTRLLKAPDVLQALLQRLCSRTSWQCWRLEAVPCQLQQLGAIATARARGLLTASAVQRRCPSGEQVESSDGGTASLASGPGRRFRTALEYSSNSRIWSLSSPAASRSRSHCCCIVSSRSCVRWRFMTTGREQRVTRCTAGPVAAECSG